jgi:hypothetical protein
MTTECVTPLPVILKPQQDELLSSWLQRHATYYRVGARRLLQHFGLSAPSLQYLDHYISLPQSILLAGFFRRQPADISAMTHTKMPLDLQDMTRWQNPAQICQECTEHHEQNDACGTTLKNWMQTWRVTCQLCGSTLSEVPSAPNDAGNQAHGPFMDYWDIARKGETIFDHHAFGSAAVQPSPVTVMRLLMLPRWPSTGEMRGGYRPLRLLDLLISDFDIKIYQNGLDATARRKLFFPLSIRIALLAGVALTMKSPSETIAKLEAETSCRSRARFHRIAYGNSI